MSFFKQPLDKTAFGELSVASPTPLTQISAQYGLLPNVLTVLDSGASGTVSVVNEKYTCQTGTASDGLSSILTLRQLTYKAGQGALARFTALFTAGVADANQLAGLITAENLFTFAQIGANFGILHGFGGVDELQELTLTAPSTVPESATVTIDGTGFTVPLTAIGTVQDDAFEISESLNAQVPNYDFTSNNDQVVAQSVLPGAQGAFAYTSGTSAGAWVQILGGADINTNFIPQASWNADTRIDTDENVNLDPTKGNVYQIQFQYLGFGAIKFSIEDKDTGDLVLVHTIKFANTSTLTSITNPTFRVGWLASNVGNTTNVTVEGGSAGAFIEGKMFRDAPPRSVSHDQASITTTLTNIVSLRNRITFADKVNRAELLPLLVAGSTQTNKFAFFRVLVNPTYAAPVTFEYVDKSSSIAETATDAVAVSGGREVGTITVVAGSSETIRFNQTKDITIILPGDTVCIAAVVPTGAASDCQVALTWQEDV